MKPVIHRISQLLGVPENEARNFCTSVQKCFEHAPSFLLIQGALESLPRDERVVGNVVKILEASGKMRSFKPYNQRRKVRVAHIPSTGFASLESDEQVSPVLAHDPRDHIAHFEKCPHGIPKFQKCAICDPKGYRELMGID